MAALDPAGAVAAAAATIDTFPGSVAVCIPDLTRPLDPRPALTALEAVFGAAMRVVIGRGLHRPMRPEELAPLLRWAPRQSDPDRTVAYGEVEVQTAAGPRTIPGRIDRAVADAGAIVTVGVCELHQYAGLSGGHKGAVIGCGGRPTIAALHDRDVVTDPQVRVGMLHGNPFREAIDALGEQLRVSLSLCFVPGPDLWLAGEPVALVQEAARRVQPWSWVDTAWDRVVLRVPAAKASSFYQASRAATYLALSPRPPLVEGAELLLDAACAEGLGSEAGFGEALASGPSPWSHLLTGPPPQGDGAQRAVMLALLARRYRLRVVGCQQPQALQAVGIDATADPAPADAPLVSRPFQSLPQLRG